MKKGFRLWQCDECKEKSWFHWIERNRAARMRCPRCGCSRLEIVSDEGYQDMVFKQRERVNGPTSTITNNAIKQTERRKKVT